MKSIVTGGAGFIGSHLSERLISLGHNVTIIDNFSVGKKNNIKSIQRKIKIVNQDIRNYKAISKHFKNIDNVFHLAALADIVPSIENPSNYFSSNVQGTFNVLKASQENKVKRFLYSASSSCYGIPKNYPTSEKEKISTKYPYALTKRLGEELVLHFAEVYRLNATSLRFFNVYGKRARSSGTYGAVFGVFLAQKVAKKPFTIVGNGRQKRDFTHVSDIVSALIKVSEKKNLKNKIFNVGSGKTVSINRIADLLGGEKVFIPKRPGEPETTFADIGRIKKEVKWKPKISIEEGVKELKESINDWKLAPVWTPEKIKRQKKNGFII